MQVLLVQSHWSQCFNTVWSILTMHRLHYQKQYFCLGSACDNYLWLVVTKRVVFNYPDSKNYPTYIRDLPNGCLQVKRRLFQQIVLKAWSGLKKNKILPYVIARLGPKKKFSLCPARQKMLKHNPSPTLSENTFFNQSPVLSS